MRNIWLYDGGHAGILGLTSNLFPIMWNVPTVVSIKHIRHGCDCIIYSRFVVQSTH